MIRFSNTVSIRRPVEEVFAYLADFTNVPRWNYYIEDVQQLTPGPPRIGTTYQQARRHDRQRYRITALDAPRAITVQTDDGEQPAFTRRLRLEASEEGTRVVDAWELDTGHPRLVERLGASRVGAAVAGNLEVLARLLDEGTARLQDGRLTTLR